MNSEAAKAAFLCACTLDVAVRKPGNVSQQSAGHRMQAQMFLDSAQAAAGPLFTAGLGVGERIEVAVRATWAAAGCNTNLGILLLCAPVAVAVERYGAASPATLESVLQHLSVEDARAAYRGIALANPGGLGAAAEQDVNDEPSIGLREAMGLAAERDLIARQYLDGYRDLFDRRVSIGLLPCNSSVSSLTAAVQVLYLDWLSSFVDSHIVRKHGIAVAQTVMTAAQVWRDSARAGEPLDDSPAFLAWDESLKAQGINPGTTADLTVATLMLSALQTTDPAGGTDRDT